jgi:hypothetical protein
MKNPTELGLGSGGEVGHELDLSYSHFPILVAEILHHLVLGHGQGSSAKVES